MFSLQLISAYGVLGQGRSRRGGVTFMAHIGRFIAGAVLVGILPSAARRPGTREVLLFSDG